MLKGRLDGTFRLFRTLLFTSRDILQKFLFSPRRVSHFLKQLYGIRLYDFTVIY